MDERRKNPRYDSKLDFSLGPNNDGVQKAQSVNISARGLSCVTNQSIPAMSKLNVQMELPFKGGASEMFECIGVVVRSEQLEDGQFTIAIYFLEIAEEAQAVVERYLAELS